MVSKSSTDAHRIRLLCFARAEIIRLSKAAARGNSSQILKRIDTGAKTIKAQMSQGDIPMREAKPALARFAAARRETVRLQSTAASNFKRTLKFLDTELKRARQGD